MKHFDTLNTKNEQYVIIGTDEAGRGPLAGPVCAAAVVLPRDFPFEILNDSKSLSPKKRSNAEIIIKEKAIAYGISWASAQEIDEINILQASLLAMKRAYIKVCNQLKNLGITPDILLVDGNKTPTVDISCKAIVKGDSSVHQIMAASILAKTARDRFMLHADNKWPQYGFAKHKGYPSKMHAQTILEFGFCPIHRKTFKVPNY